MNIESDYTQAISQKNSIFKIGNVFSVEGLIVKIKVDKQKNSSHLLYKGDLIKNVSVGGYIKIVKGFISIIAKVSGEYIKEEKRYNPEYKKEEDKIDRILIVQLLGYIENSKFEKGIKELPLIDNLCFLLDKNEFSTVHDFVSKKDHPIKIGTLALEKGQDINIGVNSLFASHIGIFGNTGSGKSYTLAHLYRKLFLEFDFNGEYNTENCIISDKTVYNISTRDQEGGDLIPFSENDFLNIEIFSIMANATEKTQEPFLNRTIKQYKNISEKENPIAYFKKVLENKLYDILCMKDSVKSVLLLDYFKAIFNKQLDASLTDDIEFHSNENRGWKIKNESTKYFSSNRNFLTSIKLYSEIETFVFPENFIQKIIAFLYLQLVIDVLDNRAQNEHIAPAISKLKSFQNDFEKVFDIKSELDFWNKKNFAVINLDKTNLKIKKIIPLLLSHKLYSEHKNKKEEVPKESLNIIVDEAHNILSYSSQRESETWKDYRLETFEEIIKEGRKFGVFLTIASQRPSDISPTILSQLHNYFIHRLINEKDLESVGRTISYLDKVSQDALSILPTGACVFAGLSAQIPVIIQIDEFLEKKHEPNNKTINLLENWFGGVVTAENERENEDLSINGTCIKENTGLPF
ncbi:MAG: ATP-binding protein [Paludibacter sp.]|nr:ATP-binding protein [Paludibacter sp.]MDD4198520.1 ATP-binding protein [Paludibacter sp.]MDD4427998.1 ATP-binding protein [Paludibacter sp.]